MLRWGVVAKAGPHRRWRGVFVWGDGHSVCHRDAARGLHQIPAAAPLHQEAHLKS